MWCPKCKSEYRSGFTVCTDCGTALAEKPLDFDPVFLEKTQGDSAWELPELLRRAGITCYLYAGNGAFIRVLSGQEVPGELYVDRGDRSAAQRCCRLLSAPPQPVEEDVLMEAYDAYMEQAEPEEDTHDDTASGNAAWKVFLALGAILLVCLLAALALH